MAYSDITTTEQKLNKITENDLLLVKLESICNWKQFLEPAPTTIAIIGQLISIATTKDFCLNKKIPEGGFHHVKYPSSFRACLLQICNSGCEAFMEAHKNMNKIQMYTVQIQKKMMQAVSILKIDTEVDKIQMLSGKFKGMIDDATKCVNLAGSTATKFSNVVLLIDEISLAAAASKGVYEDDLIGAVEKMKLLQIEEKQIETRKVEMNEEKKRVIEEVAKAKTAFDKSVDQLPGLGTLLLLTTNEEGMKMVNGAIHSIGQYKTMTAAGEAFSIVTSLLKNCPEDMAKTSVSEKQSGNQTEKDSQNRAKLKASFQHAKEIHDCVEKMFGMFKENTDPYGKHEMKVDIDKHKNKLKEIKDELVQIKADLKKSEFAKDPKVVSSKETCKTVIEHCEKILKLKTKNAEKLFKKMEKLRTVTKEFEHKAHNFLGDSLIPMTSTSKMQTEQSSNSIKMFEKITESKNIEIKHKREELDATRAAWEKLKDENRKINEEQNRVLERLSNTKIESINFEEVQKTLSDGLIVLSQLKNQWAKLTDFFENIISLIEIYLIPDTNEMNSNLSLCLPGKDILEMATSVQCVAYGIQLIATAYTDISKKHLVPNTASLGELIAYDPVKHGPELEQRRKQIDEDCKIAKAEIQQLADRTRKDMDQKIDSINRQLNEQYDKLQQPNPLVKVQEIAENVEKP